MALPLQAFVSPARVVYVCQRCFRYFVQASPLSTRATAFGSVLKKTKWVDQLTVRNGCMQQWRRTVYTAPGLLTEKTTTQKNEPSSGAYHPTPSSYKAHWENTFITASRAMNDYLLDLEDLKDLNEVKVRSANTGPEKHMMCYLKTDVEQRALEVWGSWQVLEHQLHRRRMEAEEEERRRKGLSTLITRLKKVHKDQTRRERDVEGKCVIKRQLYSEPFTLKEAASFLSTLMVFGGRQERVTFLRGSARVVMYAIASNVAVFVVKLLAYFHTSSAAMLSEAIHSLVDALNQCLLAFGIAQSIRVPDPDHPYGWSRARYVYSLISGVGIFFLGAGVTCYHGITGLLHPPLLENLPTAFGVLGASLLVEGVTLWTAIKQVQRSAKETQVKFKDYVLRGRDPTAVAVLMEDSAAVAGVFIAAAALGLAHYTDSTIYDSMGSIAIGGLLGVVALFLINRNSSALVGQSIPPERLKEIIALLESDIMIRSIHDVKATDMGAESVRFKAEVNFDGREVAKAHVQRLDLEVLLKEVQGFKTVGEMERFLLEHGEQIVDVLGSEVDRIEDRIKKRSPEVRHVDLEIL